MSDRGDKERLTAYLDVDVIEAIEAVADEYSLSKSRVVSDVLSKQVSGDGDLSDAVEDAIPEATRRLAVKQREDRRMRDRQELREKRASWKDRIKGHFRERIEGDEAYRPDDMSELAEGYVEDAEIWMDDEDRVDEARDQVDEWLSFYRAGYWAREHADAVDTEICGEHVSGWFAVGEDVHTLRTRIDEVEDLIHTIADGDAFDSDAVVSSVASRFTVCTGAVRLLIELMIEDDSTVQEAILAGGDTLGSARTAAGRLSAGAASSERALTDGDGRGGDGVEDDRDDAEVVVIDGHEIAKDQLGDAVAATGDATDRSEPVEVSRADGHASRVESDGGSGSGST